MDNLKLENIKTLLENYHKVLMDRAITYADMMADWTGSSVSEATRYADMYDLNRKERQRVENALFDVEFAIDHEQDAK